MQLQPVARWDVATLEKWDAGVEMEIGVEIGVVAAVVVDALVKPVESVLLPTSESSGSRLGR